MAKKKQSPSCVMPNCTTTPHAQNLCWKHYSQWKRAGRPELPLVSRAAPSGIDKVILSLDYDVAWQLLEYSAARGIPRATLVKQLIIDELNRVGRPTAVNKWHVARLANPHPWNPIP